MVINYIDQKIRQAFSDAAYHYDVLASLHKEIGRELLKKTLESENADVILDIGMGTGWLTKKMKFYFSESKVLGIDFASGMVQKANEENDGIHFIQADASRLPLKENSVDLMISNLSLQWVRDLQGTLTGCRQVLKENGTIFFTMFGYKTFMELFLSLESSLAGTGKKKEISRLLTRDQVEAALAGSGLRNIHCDHEFIKVRYPDMYSIVRWIKDIGANNLSRNFYVGKQLLDKANDHYEKNFKDKLGAYATFEVIWARGEK